MVGMSVGGAVAADLSKTDDRIQVGINIDGTYYGTHLRDTLKTPFLSIYSDDGVGINDHLYYLSDHLYQELHVRGTKHTDFTDFPLVWPILGLYGQLGTISPERLHTMTNDIILGFLTESLSEDSLELEWSSNYPEVEVRSK